MASWPWRSPLGLLAAVLAAGIIFIGSRFMLAPGAGADGYGVAVAEGADAYLRAKGLRDIVSGLLLFAVLLIGTRRVAGWFLVVAAIIPLGDAALVLSAGGSFWTAVAVHGGTAIAMLVIAILILRRSRSPAQERQESIS